MRGIQHLHPDVQFIAQSLIDSCKKQNLNICITDTFRTRQEQNAIPAEFTGCKYPYSMHNWGLAFDFCKNSKTAPYDDSDGFFKKVGNIGKSLGLEWGGDWTNPVDKPHLQLNRYGLQKQLIAKYGTPDTFKKTWRNGGDEMKIKVNEKVIEIEMVNRDNHTYVKLRDLEKAGFIIGYDAAKKMPIVTTK